MSKPAIINRVNEEFGALGNMSRHPLEYQGKTWPRAEHLFQAFRLKPEAVDLREEIRLIENPMAAKQRAKEIFVLYPEQVRETPCSEEDVSNMFCVLNMKWAQHGDVQTTLMLTGAREIIEDATRRQGGSGLFWGAALQEDGTWRGRNTLGKLWMALRENMLGVESPHDI